MWKAISGNNVLLNFNKEEEGNFNDLLVVNNLKNFYGKQYDSSVGLSDRNIASIVIGCICALILVGFLALCCRKKKKSSSNGRNCYANLFIKFKSR